MTKNIISSTDFPYDMSAWCIEKSSGVLKDIVESLEYFEKVKDDLPNSIKEDLYYRLSSPINNITKVVAFSCGAEWSTDDPDLILKGGYDGYELVAYKYGLIKATKEQIKQKEEEVKIGYFQFFLLELEKLISGGQANNRTLIHVLLDKTRSKDPYVEEVRELIEEVTMGRLDWVTFQQKTQSGIKKYKNKS